MPSQRPLTPTENRIALVTLELVASWPRWVHRRVETLSFIDDVTVRRSVSVDFTLPTTLPAPLPAIEGHNVHVVPLGLLRKAALRDFDLSDESGAALPLMTSAKNGAIAAGALINAAEITPSDDELAGLPRRLPPELRDELWSIATGSAPASLRRWERLGHPEESDSYAAGQWRRYLAEDRDFMALASDLARNFLVLTPLITPVGRRRIVKLSYEQTEENLDTFLRAATKASPKRRRRKRKRRVAEPGGGPGGVGRLRLQATTLLPEEEGVVPAPLDVEVVVSGPAGFRTRVRTGEAGEKTVQLAAAVYLLEEVVPTGQLELTERRRTVEVQPGQEVELWFEHRPIAEWRIGPPEPAPRRRRWPRLLGWEPEVIAFFVPSVGQTQSYHVEFDAPEGLQITTAVFSTRSSFRQVTSPADATPTNGEGPSMSERGSVQRSHLHVSDVPQGFSGVARFAVRPRPSTIVRAAALSAAVTTGLLLIVRLGFELAGPNVGAVATLLLFVPGGLSAYVARPREHLVATGMLFGLRLLALAEGLLALLAALVVVFGRRWSIGDNGAFTPGEVGAGVDAALSVLVIASALIAASLMRAWRRTARPPEIADATDSE